MSAGVAPRPRPRPIAVVAAGLLGGSRSIDELTIDAATARLQALLTPAALWVRGGLGGRPADVVLGVPPWWQPPTTDLSPETAATLEAAWDQVVGEHRPPDQPVLRLCVGDERDAAALTAIDRVGDLVLVPTIETHAERFSWRWPLTVAVGDGPSAAQWTEQLPAEFIDDGFFADIVSGSDPGPETILVVDASASNAYDQIRWADRVACIIVVGPDAGGVEELAREARGAGSAISVGVVADDLSWFAPVVDELAHDQPLDVALRLVLGDVTVAGDPRQLELTSLTRWVAALAAGIPPGSPADLHALLRDVPFDRERNGAREVLHAVASLHDAAYLTRVDWEESSAAEPPDEPWRDDDHADAAAQPPPRDLAEPPPPPPPTPPPRDLAEPPAAPADADVADDVPSEAIPAADDAEEHRERIELGETASLDDDTFVVAGTDGDDDLIVRVDDIDGDGTITLAPGDLATATSPTTPRELLIDLFEGNALRRVVLAPETDHELVARIAVPKADERHGLRFDERSVPTADGTADLVVDVVSADGTISGSDEMVLPTENRSRSSTPARIRFRTGAEGSTLSLRVTVLHLGRPIQAARVVAPVRAVELPHDAVEVFPLRLTADPEPRPTTTPADATLDATTSVIFRIGEPARRVELADIGAILGAIEERASRTLGSDDAPAAFTAPGARELLIDLASMGRQLRRKIDTLGLDDATTIAVVVSHDSDVIPLEMVYDGPAPDDTAKLCSHTKNPPKPGARCTKASTTIVCPYAFWGMRRTIARTILAREQAPVPAGRPTTAPLALRPVLYAAAAKADGGKRTAKPSVALEQVLTTLAGSTVARVKTWKAWRRVIATATPQMLVVLGHTAVVSGQATIVIGDRSPLRQPAVELDVLGRAGAPAPILLLISCSSVQAGDAFGALPATFVEAGAAAVVATLTKINGQQGSEVAASIARALFGPPGHAGLELGGALTTARRELLANENLAGLLIVAQGEIDVQLTDT